MRRGEKAPAKVRFHRSIKQEGNCIVWTRKKNQDGYGRLRYEGRKVMAHRYAWFLHYGNWPEGEINHLCCNPACVNVAHLEDGTHQSNIAYMTKLGRQHKPKGMEHSRAKLNDNQVHEIRREYAVGNVTKMALGKKYGVSDAHICNIINGKSWSHI